MKIIHTADWHLGQTFYGYERREEHAVFLDWLCRIVAEKQCNLLLIAGDVFDTPNPSAAAQRMYYHFLKRITEENPNLQIIVTAGNHDSAARIEAPAPLLESFNIFVSGIVHYCNEEIDYDSMIVPLRCGGCCLAVPYLRHNDHPEADSYGEGVKKLYSQLYNRAVERGFSPVIAMGHLQASGAQVSVGDSCESLVIGGLEGIGTSITDEGIAYTALGHLHKAQRVGGRENVRYSGSPLPMSFAEKNNRQSVCEIDIDENGTRIKTILFDAPVKLLSIPPTPQPLDVVLEELSALADGTAGDESPFLEVRISVTAIDPAMRQTIEDAISGKNVRLARIEAVSNRENNEASTVMTYEDFKNTEPVEIMKDIYRKEHGEELPANLESMLSEVIKEAMI